MQGVVIQDASDLSDVLRVLGACARDSEWVCSGVECFGTRAEDLHRLSDTGERVPGRTLAKICSSVSQTIDGYFRAYAHGASEPWLIIRAVEGDFDVRCDEPSVFAAVQQHFYEVVPFPPDSN